MSTVTISKREYRELAEKKLRYDYLRQILENDIFSAPSLRSRKAIMTAFKASKKYNRNFLDSLKKGLLRSVYFKS